MYVEKGNPITKEQVIEKMKTYPKYIKGMEAPFIDGAAQSLVNLNDALLNGRDVWAVCVKEPRGNLDTGNHYYTVNFINKEGRRDRVWLYGFEKALGGKEWNRDWSIPKWVWYSGAIGMSRLLDATDGLFSFLKRLGGCYAQIDVRY